MCFARWDKHVSILLRKLSSMVDQPHIKQFVGDVWVAVSRSAVNGQTQLLVFQGPSFVQRRAYFSCFNLRAPSKAPKLQDRKRLCRKPKLRQMQVWSQRKFCESVSGSTQTSKEYPISLSVELHNMGSPEAGMRPTAQGDCQAHRPVAPVTPSNPPLQLPRLPSQNSSLGHTEADGPLMSIGVHPAH